MKVGFGAELVAAVSPALDGAENRYSVRGLICGSPWEVAMDPWHGSFSPGSTHHHTPKFVICLIVMFTLLWGLLYVVALE